ncbi:MAG: DUF4435 domain-containing protein [Candidatus Poribacteria bacterium]|nr:DUF4435 domain-containing protein [Candidatus Poribacteria bacterium]
MSFSRTPLGAAAEYLFYQEILVYVEGHTDIPFYEKVLQGYDCYIKPQGGREECKKLVPLLSKDNLPFVIILDGDYEILARTQGEHSRVILLDRYSFENYLFEEQPIEQFCRHRHPRVNLERLLSRFRKVVENIEVQFKELIVLDVAHRSSHTGYKVLPDRPQRFLGRGPVDFKDSEIQEWCERAAQGIDEQNAEDARILVDEFLKRHRLIDLLPGHFAFAIIRRLIIKTVNRSIADDDITIPLSTSVWDLVKTRDHNSLKRRLHEAVREAEKIRQANSSPAQSNTNS